MTTFAILLASLFHASDEVVYDAPVPHTPKWYNMQLVQYKAPRLVRQDQYRDLRDPRDYRYTPLPQQVDVTWRNR